MGMTKAGVETILHSKVYAVLVTCGKNGMTSRTMVFGYAPEDKIFLMTHKSTSKLEDIRFSNDALIHLNSIEENITDSFDITIDGEIKFVEPGDEFFDLGAEALGAKNPMVKDILSEPTSRADYQLLMFSIKSLKSWSYLQVLNGEPKTVLI